MITSVTRTPAGIASKGAKCLAQRIDGRSLSETGDETAVVFHREVHIAVGTSECPEIGDYPISPQGCVFDIIARQVGHSSDPASVIDAMSATSELAAQRAQACNG